MRPRVLVCLFMVWLTIPIAALLQTVQKADSLRTPQPSAQEVAREPLPAQEEIIATGKSKVDRVISWFEKHQVWKYQQKKVEMILHSL